MRTHCERERTGWLSGRGLRSISPDAGLSKPRAMAMGTCTRKLIHKTTNGVNGTPPAMTKNAAPRYAAMKATSAVIWKRM